MGLGMACLESPPVRRMEKGLGKSGRPRVGKKAPPRATKDQLTGGKGKVSQENTTLS